jgi:ElaB protein
MEARMANADVTSSAARAHEMIDSTVEKVQPAMNRMVGKAHETIDRIAPAAASMQAAMHQATDQSVRLAEAAANTIRAKPWTALASAAAVGYILGRLMR